MDIVVMAFNTADEIVGIKKTVERANADIVMFRPVAPEKRVTVHADLLDLVLTPRSRAAL